MDDALVVAVARGIVASDFIEQRLGELTEGRWQEMLKHWRELESEPAIRSGHRVDDAMRRARAAIAAIAAFDLTRSRNNDGSADVAAGE